MRRNWFCAKSATCARAPMAPSTLPTQMRASAGGARRDSLPVLSASSSGAPCSSLGFAQRHADQRAVGADGQLEHVAFDAVGLGEIALGARRRHALVGDVVLAQQLVAEEAGNTAGRRRAAPGRSAAARTCAAARASRRRRAGWRWPATSRSLSRISGELPTIVSAPPITMAAAIGISRRDIDRPVREDRREATGRYSAITDGFCMKDELSPATARGQQQQALLDAVRAPQQPGGEPVERAGAVQPGAEDHRRDDADHRVAGEAVEQVLGGDQAGQAEQHQHHQRDQVGAHALEQEHHHRQRRPARGRASCRW